MRVLWIIACLLAAGCAALKPEALSVNEIIAGAVKASHLTAEGQRRELARANDRFARESNDIDRVRLAALLATLPAPLRDDARAASLLQPLLKQDAPLAQFAQLLAATIEERQRVVRDARTVERREESLRQQLEALKTIERGIFEREERLRARQR